MDLHGHEIPPGPEYGLRSESRCTRAAAPGSDPQRGWTLYKVFCDRVSGATERRPGLDALMADARRGALEVVVVFRFDRFARSVKQLVLALEEFRSLGIDFISHLEALDTSTPMGEAMFAIIAAMAQLEEHHP